MEIPDSHTARGRVLVGGSVFEDADLTIREGTLYIEFDAAGLDDIAVDLAALSRKESSSGE